MQFNRKLIVISLMATVVLSAVAFTNPPVEDNGFKNLKILPKDISHEKLGKIMHELNGALGVHCDFCHALSKDPAEKHPDFASDEKQKKIRAREMMKMIVKINKKIFGAKDQLVTLHYLLAVLPAITENHNPMHPSWAMSMSARNRHRQL